MRTQIACPAAPGRSIDQTPHLSNEYEIHRSSQLDKVVKVGRTTRRITLTIVGWPSSASKKSFPDFFQDGSQSG